MQPVARNGKSAFQRLRNTVDKIRQVGGQPSNANTMDNNADTINNVATDVNNAGKVNHQGIAANAFDPNLDFLVNDVSNDGCNRNADAVNLKSSHSLAEGSTLPRSTSLENCWGISREQL